MAAAGGRGTSSFTREYFRNGAAFGEGEIAKRPSHFVGPSPSAGDADFLLFSHSSPFAAPYCFHNLSTLTSLSAPPSLSQRPCPFSHHPSRQQLASFLHPVRRPLAEGPPGQGVAPSSCLKRPPGAEVCHGMHFTGDSAHDMLQSKIIAIFARCS